MRMPSPNAHWRDSARTVKFFFLDGKAVFPFVLFLMHMRLWTFILAFIATIFFTTIARYGFGIRDFLRWVRSLIAGKRKYSTPWWMM